MDQQQQTREYFERFAQDWQSQAATAGANYNLIESRNNAVIAAIRRSGRIRRILDVGCGTGQLVIQAARLGVDSTGIDFAKDMIAQCEVNRQEAGVAATFAALSFFDLPAPAQKFDLISAQGFIEYISPEQLEQFFARCAELLSPGGLLVVGSRNRLFNCVSLNEFTRIERALGVLDPLIEESISISSSDSQVQAFTALRQHERIYPQPTAHPITGIRVDVRYQYSPAELVKRLRAYSFSPQMLYPIHFHALPAGTKQEHPEVHSQLAMLAERIAPLDQRLVPHCSTFVLEVRLDK